jgi:hypothetical protein
MSIGLAFKAFFAVLFNKEAAHAVQLALKNLPAASPKQNPPGGNPGAAEAGLELAPTEKARGDKAGAEKSRAEKASSQPGGKATPTAGLPPSGRSDALTLLSTLQREARLLDLVYEPLEGFEDAQVGAAARQVLSDTHKALSRMFAIEPLSDRGEGDLLDLPKPASPLRYKIAGRGAEGAERGTLVHRGWKATHCQVPSWTGGREDSLVLAPIEIEVDG